MQRIHFHSFISSILLVCALLFASIFSPSLVKAGTPTGDLYDNGIYRIRNVKTGLYLTAYSTTNSDGINVIQKAYNATNKAQQWRLVLGDGQFFIA